MYCAIFNQVCIRELGPLITYDGDNRATLIGITSWGIGCGEVGVPGLFAKVDHVLKWIHDTINEFKDGNEDKI